MIICKISFYQNAALRHNNVKNILVLLDFTSCVTEFLNYACLTYWISVYIHDIHVLIMCLLFVLYLYDDRRPQGRIIPANRAIFSI